MADTRHKDQNWALNKNPNGTMNCDAVAAAVLMDIRDELKLLNQTFRCHRFLRIPDTLDAILRNTNKKRKNPKA